MDAENYVKLCEPQLGVEFSLYHVDLLKSLPLAH